MQQQGQVVVIAEGQKPKVRGRWQEVQKRLLVDTYNDLFMPYIDAKVIAVICKGIPRKYALKGGS